MPYLGRTVPHLRQSTSQIAPDLFRQAYRFPQLKLWCGSCISSIVRLVLIFAFGLVISSFAQAADQDSDPSARFAAYDRSVNQQISAILQNEQVPSFPPSHEKPAETAPVKQSSGSAEQIGVFAKQFWRGRNGDLTSALFRLQALRPALDKILESEGVPTELVAIVLIESAAKEYALSAREARGLWQFIPETARQYGLHVSADRDERVEIEHATRAAARYLRDLHSTFGDWPLALAAYNAGQYTVEKAIRLSRATSFWQLSAGGRLPEETRNYVPAVLAAMRLLKSDSPSRLIHPPPTSAKWIYAPLWPTN